MKTTQKKLKNAPTPAPIPKTFWHTAVYYGNNFADFQIEIQMPFFDLGRVRRAIEGQVQKPTVIVSWTKLSEEQYKASAPPVEAPAAPVEAEATQAAVAEIIEAPASVSSKAAKVQKAAKGN